MIVIGVLKTKDPFFKKQKQNKKTYNNHDEKDVGQEKHLQKMPHHPSMRPRQS